MSDSSQIRETLTRELSMPSPCGMESQPPPLPVRCRPLPSDHFFHWVLFGLALTFVLVSAIGLRLAGWTIALSPLALRAVPLVLFLCGIAFYRWRRERRIVNVLIVVFWSLTFGIVYLAPMYLAARCPVPFRDDVLAGMDRALGIEAPAIVRLMEAAPGVKRFLDLCYDTLLFLVVVAIMLPPLCGRMGRAKEYLVAGIASAVLSIPIFAVLPAQGPWCYYGYRATPEQDKVTQIIVGLKSADNFVLNVSDTEGIISFPSFHTVLALLAAFALWSLPYVRWPAALLASLIMLSTVTTGWHYLVDVVAGVLIAVVSCLVGKGYTRLEARWARTSLVTAVPSRPACAEPATTP